jgi:hypothetical protein
MKKTLCITALCAVTALFSGCWKKKEKTETMESAISTDANDTIMSDEKPIKVAALSEMSSGMNSEVIAVKGTDPSNGDKKEDNTNDEQAISQKKDEDGVESDFESTKKILNEKKPEKAAEKKSNTDNEKEKEEKATDENEEDMDTEDETDDEKKK